MTKKLLFAAALSLALPVAAMAAGSGAGSDVQATKHPPTTAATTPAHVTRLKAPRKYSATGADYSADQLNAKQLATVQARDVAGSTREEVTPPPKQ